MNLPTGASRWPDFLLIGAPKAGTTALFKALSRHPDICVSPDKEPRYFAFSGKRPSFRGPAGKRIANTIVCEETDYLDLFRHCPSDKRTGEASTTYLYSESAASSARACVPDARIIAVLRHPVDRGFSQWLHLRQEGMETETDFAKAWTLGAKRIAEGWPPVYAYRERGFYGSQIKRWFRHYPAEQVLVLFYEDWLQRPDETLQHIFLHLGVDDSWRPRITRENVSSRQPRWKWLHHQMVDDNRVRRWAQKYLPLAARDFITSTVTGINLREGPKLDSALRRRLSDDFRDDIELLEKLLAVDLTHWKTWE